MTKFTMKLNRDKLAGIYGMLSYLLEQQQPQNKADKLINSLVFQIKIKMRNQLDRINTSAKYQITLTQHEALAFELWFNRLTLPQSAYLYECNVAQALCNDIDRIYG